MLQIEKEKHERQERIEKVNRTGTEDKNREYEKHKWKGEKDKLEH